MTSTVVALSLSYAAVAALLLNLNLATPFSTPIKLGAIVLVTCLYGVTWHSVNGLLGWATPDALPSQFKLHWITVDEPDKATGADGTIFFWIRELDRAGLPAGQPRAYRVPWTEETAEAAEEALAQLTDGVALNGFVTREMIDPANPDEFLEGEDYYENAVSLSGDGNQALSFEFRRVPPPALPPKSVPQG